MLNTIFSDFHTVHSLTHWFTARAQSSCSRFKRFTFRATTKVLHIYMKTTKPKEIENCFQDFFLKSNIIKLSVKNIFLNWCTVNEINYSFEFWPYNVLTGSRNPCVPIWQSVIHLAGLIYEATSQNTNAIWPTDIRLHYTKLGHCKSSAYVNFNVFIVHFISIPCISGGLSGDINQNKVIKICVDMTESTTIIGIRGSALVRSDMRSEQ